MAQGRRRYKGIDPTQLKALTDYFQQVIVKALEPILSSRDSNPAPTYYGWVAITDLIPTKPEMSVVTLVVPYATVADLAAGGGTGSTPYLGQTAIEAEFLDSRSNQVLAAYVDREIGKKYDINLSQGGFGGGERRFVLHQCLQYLGLRRSRVRRLGWPITQATRRSAWADGADQLKTNCSSSSHARVLGSCG